MDDSLPSAGAPSRRRFLLLTLAFPLALAAHRPSAVAAQLSELLDLGERLAEEHLDPSVLKAIRSGDPGQLDQVLKQVTSGLQGGSVPELAGLRELVNLALPVLERTPQTRAYAPWLRSRLDYFEVADQFRSSVPASPSKPGRSAPAASNPTPAQERAAWQRQVNRQAPPKGAATWVPRLKPVFRSAGAPSELVWLAEIESSFDPTAKSPAGAAGMYQLMPATARGLGLKLQPSDERMVPEKGARAAAGYLRKLHGQFKDWRLALAAYNAGPGRVSDLLKKRRATSYDAIAPALPAETQMYVPKFEALLKKREGRALGGLVLPPLGRA